MAGHLHSSRVPMTEGNSNTINLEKMLHTGYGPYPVNGYNPNVAHDNALFLFPFVHIKSSIAIFTKKSEEKGRDLKNIVLLLIIWDLGKISIWVL
ncbi:hypothetical protein AKJ16_DCAP10686 [Drosera capensis]